MGVNPLKRARLERGITLAVVAERTRLSPRIVALLDAGAYDQLPAGLYARSYVRAFAAAVGLCPHATLDELADRLPREADPFPAFREKVGEPPPAPRETSDSPYRRAAATAADGGLVLLWYVALLRLTAWSAGVDLYTVTRLAGVPVALVCAVVGVLYFVLLGTIGGCTLGTVICRPRGQATLAGTRSPHADAGGQRELTGVSAAP